MHQDQTGFLYGRYLKNNVWKVVTINKAQLRNTPVVLLFLDAEKAFDRIEWKYIFHVIKKFGIEDNFLAWLTLLYRDHSTHILSEGQIL